MAKYRFVVKSSKGRVRKGTITEKDEASAKARLVQAGFQVMGLTEEADLVVHTDTSSVGRQKYKPSRANIIEFEESAGEKAWRFLNDYFLRKESAVLLAVLGVIWMGFSSLGGDEPAPVKTPEFVLYTTAVTVDPAEFEADEAVVRFPDIPTKSTHKLEGGGQTFKVEFQAARPPERVEVYLVRAGERVAQSKGALQGTRTSGFSFTPQFEKL